MHIDFVFADDGSFREIVAITDNNETTIRLLPLGRINALSFSPEELGIDSGPADHVLRGIGFSKDVIDKLKPIIERPTPLTIAEAMRLGIGRVVAP